MSTLQPQVHIGSQSSKYKVVNEGDKVAPWFPNYEKSTWWNGGDTYTGFYYSVHGNTLYIQYGKNATGWAGTRMFVQSYEISNEKINEDNSIEADIKFTFSNFEGFRTDYFVSGVPVKLNIKIAGQTVASYTGTTGTRFTLTPKPNTVTVHVKIQPQQKTSQTTLEQETIYTTGIFPNASMFVGFDFYNPLPSQYIAGTTYINNSWRSNNNNGYNKVLINGTWESFKENNSTQNASDHGHTRVFKDGHFKQAKKY